jgi:MurNAc alpha-1-phosphate uridylyltransferase
MLEAHVQKRSNPKIKISREEVVLETGGGIKNALHLFGDEPFFVLNSDVICIDGKTPALHRLWQYWDDAKMDALLLLNVVESAIGYAGQGDFFLEDGKLRRRAEGESAPYVFTGIQLISPRLFKNSSDGKFSLNLLYNRDLSRIGAVIHDGNWLHIGSPEELSQAENWLVSYR